MRLICLRLSDIKRVEAYLQLLAEEKILRFTQRPDHKRSFVLPVDPGETIPEGLDLRYSGYSFIHYQIELGENSGAIDELIGLQVEFQLRTILEEAWGEIDHKYRYAFSRNDDLLPDYIHTGFYNLSAYLQVAALQAEHLCRQLDAYKLLKTRKLKKRVLSSAIDEPSSRGIGTKKTEQTEFPATLQGLLEETFGFKLTVRTLTYILKRLEEFGYAEQPPPLLLQKIFTKKRLQKFRAIFRKVLDREAFEDKQKRNVDAINAINFSLYDETQGDRIAQEGLISVLRWRKKRSSW